MKEKGDSSYISSNTLGNSPGKKIDYQAKLLSQIDLAHQNMVQLPLNSLRSEGKYYLNS